MFDVSFSEMMVIAVVALIVIGPEKLPKVARTLGLLVGRLQRYVATVKADVEREMHAQELGKIESEVRQQVSSLESTVRDEAHSVSASVESAVTSEESKAAANKDGTGTP